MRQYLIRADEPFKGYVQSVIEKDGTVAFSGTRTADGVSPNLTLAEYRAQRDIPLKVISDDELDALIEEHHASMITGPTPETAEQFEYALNVLPPCRWRIVGGVQFFHVSEAVTGDLVNWYACIGNQHFTFIDRAGADMGDLAKKVRDAAQMPA